MNLQYRETGVKQKISVWLNNSDHTQMKPFHCPSCGYVMFTYYDDLKIMVAGEGPIEAETKPKTIIQCKNNHCKTQVCIY